MIIHLHGGVYLEQEDIPVWIKRLMIYILSGKEPKIVLSSAEKDLVTKKFQARNIFVLPNSIDIKAAKEFARKYPHKSTLKLLFFGRIVKTKGIEYIFQALEVLKERGVLFEFIMAGSGLDREEYVNRFSKLLGPNFRFMGVVSGNDKTKLLKDCDIFLLPSFYEGLPVSLLECMSFALIPLVTDVGSIKHVVMDGVNGIIIGKHSSKDIAEAIIKLMSDEVLREQLALNAQQFIFENFNPVTYIIDLNRIYKLA